MLIKIFFGFFVEQDILKYCSKNLLNNCKSKVVSTLVRKNNMEEIMTPLENMQTQVKNF